MTNASWVYARAAGLVSWWLLAGDVVLGAVLAAGRRRGSGARWLIAMHRHTSSLALGFLLVHLWGVLSDTYIGFTLADVAIPFAASWRPAAMAAGSIALWLLVIVQGTSLARSRLSRTWWRRLHLSSYAAFALSTVHAVLAGSEMTNAGAVALGAATLVAVAAVTGIRVRGLRSSAAALTEPGIDEGGDDRR